eukprot:gb/GFBE01023165.1/.p1 GENE.gb/GFBE01023165.1/~~gb/GFBE01023165.1/.p1  ORF type:complete len:492 (+),score=113.30 gb/GFBE01023165.1/:1-1476(+)
MRLNVAAVLLLVCTAVCHGRKSYLRQADVVQVDANESDIGISLLEHVQMVKAMKVTDPALPLYIQHLQSSLVALAAKRDSQLPGDASAFSKLKTELHIVIEEHLKVSIIQEHAELQQDLNSYVLLFNTCEAERAKGLNESYKAQMALPTAIANHKACRMQESLLHDKLQTCADALAAAQAVDQETCKTAEELDQVPDVTVCSGLNSETPEAYHRRMAAEFRQKLQDIRIRKLLCANATEAMNMQLQLCEDETAEVQKQRETCDSMQNAMDSCVCDLADTMSTTCNKYKACREQATLSMNVANNSARDHQVQLTKTWKALTDISCLLEHLETEAGKDACNNLVYDFSHLDVVYSPTPECQACEELAEIPGTAEYNATVFADIPHDAPPKPCTASCCLTAETAAASGSAEPLLPPVTAAVVAQTDAEIAQQEIVGLFMKGSAKSAAASQVKLEPVTSNKSQTVPDAGIKPMRFSLPSATVPLSFTVPLPSSIH